MRTPKPDGKTPKPEPFTGMTFPRFYPQHEVAEHEVLMAFNGDSDALAFYDWWDREGAVAFNQYLTKRRAVS